VVKGLRRKVFKTILINLIVWILALAWTLPYIGIIAISVMPYREVIVRGWFRIPDINSLTLKNYIEALNNPLYDLATGYKNSLIVASISTLIPLIAAALAAYAFSNLDFRLKPLLFGLILVIMMVPQQLTVVPLFFLYRNLRLYNTMQGIILLHSAWGIAWITFFLRNYFKFIPRSLIEAARVDGASDFRIFSKIVLPLSIPGLMAAALLQFTWVWNDLFYALIFLVGRENQVITQKVVMLKGEYHIDWGLLAAGSIISMSMPVILYAVFNKYFMKGVAGWGIKR
jgi:multiple sugar transport system permease protein